MAFKGIGVINFSQGVIAVIAAYTFVSLRTNLGTPLGRFVPVNGSSAVLAFVVVAVAIAGSRLQRRGERVLGRPSAVASGRVRPVALVIAGVAIWALIALTDRSTLITSTGVVTLLMLSVVVLSGYVGQIQISLMQLSLAGLGGFTVAHLSPHLPLLVDLALGGLLSAAVGVAVGLPALRVRGVNLAIVTLALAVALENILFNNQWFTGGPSGMTVSTPSVFGVDLYPLRFGIFTWIVVLVLTGVRRSSFGHRMLATRNSEPAAAAAGMNVARTKLQAFALSGFLAGLAGGMLAYPARNTEHLTIRRLRQRHLGRFRLHRRRGITRRRRHSGVHARRQHHPHIARSLDRRQRMGPSRRRNPCGPHYHPES